MGFFSNVEKHILRKKIEEQYENKLQIIFSGLKNLPPKERFKQSMQVFFAYQLNIFAKTMGSFVFNKDTGVFKNELNKLNEVNYDRLYWKMAMWFSWKRIPVKPGDKDYQECVTTNLSSLENCLGISSDEAMIYYTNLNELPDHLVNFALYRWCMLDIGHVDTNYESMHENSSDCKKFSQAIVAAIAEVNNFVKSSMPF